MSGPDVATIAQMLRGRVEDLARQLYPEGRRVGQEWRSGSHGSVAVKLTGTNQGLWSDFAENRYGDPLDMIAFTLFAGDKREALRWARSYLGLGTATRVDWQAESRRAADARARAAKAEAAARERKAGVAAAAWIRARCDITDTPAAVYLGRRGIDLHMLPKVPAALGFDPAAFCAEDDPDWRPDCGRARPERPALIAGMWALGDKTPRCVQRTFLAPGGLGKAPLREPRKTLGSWPGALCPVSRGPSGRRVRDMQPWEEVAVAEGLEEALSIALVVPEWRCFAAMYVGNFEQFRLPVPVRLKLCPNNDPADSRAADAFRRAVRVQAQQGHSIEIVRAPAPHKDWNAYLQHLVAEAAKS